MAEHHGTPLGSAPSPGLFLAAVAQRTTKLRFGPLAYPLGLYHPLRLLEEICMLDVMSGGRLELGVGRGASPYEAAFFGIEPATAQERFDETLEIVLKGLGAERLDHAGKYFTLMDVPLVMQPVQRPHPPLWHVTRSLDSADRLAALGCNVALAMPTRDAGAFTRRYRAAWAALGRAPADMPFVGNTRNVVVLDSDSDAVSAARRAFHVWYDSMVHLWRANGVELPRQVSSPDFDETVEQGYIVAGSAGQGARPHAARSVHLGHQLQHLPLRLRRPVVRGIGALGAPVRARGDAGADAEGRHWPSARRHRHPGPRPALAGRRGPFRGRLFVSLTAVAVISDFPNVKRPAAPLTREPRTSAPSVNAPVGG